MREAIETLCDRCLEPIPSGEGKLWIIGYIAICDPTTTELEQISAKELSRQLRELYAALQKVPAVDAENSVAAIRRMFLCSECYKQWDENPAGSS